MDTIKQLNLISETGFTVELITFGGIITKIMAKDRNGFRENVVLSYEVLDDYFQNPLYLGCLVGPVAGRTSGGLINTESFHLQLDTHNHPNSLHSGETGLHKVNWSVKCQSSNSVTLFYETLDSNKTTITYEITYTVLDESLEIKYFATSNAPTYLSLTNHTYFNLSGDSNKPIINQTLALNCSHYARLDSNNLPVEWVPIELSPLDFSKSKRIGDVLSSNHPDVCNAGGVDHPFKCIADGPIATLTDLDSGRVMKTYTTQNYVVVYTGNFLKSATSPSGILFGNHSGICFETQDLPDITNNGLDTYKIVTPESPYHHVTKFEFSLT